MAATDPYTLEMAETDIANLRGLVDRTTEAITKNDSTDVPNTPAAGLIHHSISGHHQYISADGNTYNSGRLTLVLGASISINSAITPVTIFSHHLGTGTYRIEAWLVTLNATAANAAGYAFAFTGTATLALVDFDSMSTGTATVGYQASATLTTQFNGLGLANNQRLHANFTIVVSVAGTLSLTGIELVNTVVTVFGGSRMDICPVTAT